jgi:DNA-binding transcriptional LysR family regulator
MDIKQLQLFNAIAEQLSFGRAAKVMGIAPSALSTQVASLETELGAPLFLRSSHSTELTPVGRALLPQARKAIAEFDLVAEVAQRAKRGDIGHLSVGYARALPWYLPGRIIGGFAQAKPDVHVDLQETTSQEQTRNLSDGLLDFGIMIGAPDDATIASKLVAQEPVFIACGPTHRFAKREGITISELRDEPLLMLTYAFSPEIFTGIMEMCRAAGFYPKISYEADEIRVLWGLVTSGHGVTFGYRSFVMSNIPGLTFIPVLDSTVHFDFYVAWNASVRDELKQSFIDLLPAYKSEAETEWASRE